MKIVIILVILLFPIRLFACVCEIKRDFKTLDDLKRYDFIALAEIRSLSPLDTSLYNMGIHQNGDIKIKVTELFKGIAIDAVTDPSYNSDCVMNLTPGQQWIIFGYAEKGKIMTGSCTYSVLYKDFNGFRDWHYFTGIKQLAVLRQLYHHAVQNLKKNKIFYPDGTNLEITQSFKNGKIDGLRNIYYPDGKIFIKEKFKQDRRIDFRQVFSEGGQLLEKTLYRRKYKKSITTYHDTAEYIKEISERANFFAGWEPSKKNDHVLIKRLEDSLKNVMIYMPVSFERYFKNDGRSYKATSFNIHGTMIASGYLNWKRKLYEWTVYHDNGNIADYTKYDKNKNLQTEYDYKENGVRRDFINKCISCKTFFDETAAPEAAPEGIYLVF